MAFNKYVKIGGSIIVVGIVVFVVATAKPGPCSVTRQISEVKGDSLAGLIEPGTKVTVLQNYYACHEPQRGDITLYKYPGKTEPLIKIIAAVPGDQWSLADNGDKTHGIVVNGKPLRTSDQTPYALSDQQAKLLSLYIRDYKGVIPKDAYLILGNKAGGTFDSSAYGLVGKGTLVGKVQK